jgi:hypothetical protein
MYVMPEKEGGYSEFGLRRHFDLAHCTRFAEIVCFWKSPGFPVAKEAEKTMKNSDNQRNFNAVFDDLRKDCVLTAYRTGSLQQLLPAVCPPGGSPEMKIFLGY